MYLENIFAGGDIRKQLAEEAKNFDSVDKPFKRLMVSVHRSPNVMRTVFPLNKKEQFNLLENLNTYNDTLDNI